MLVSAAAGLLVRRRIGYCWSFFRYLLATATCQLAIAHWPERFFSSLTSYSTKLTLLVVLKMLVALEIWQRNFSSFSRARVRVGLLLAGALLVTAAGAQMIPEGLHPYDELIGILHPRLQAGTLSLYAIIVCAASWYRVPVHPVHRAILIGFAAYLTVNALVLSWLGWHGGAEWARRSGSVVEAVAYLIAEVWWTCVAWRPLRAPSPIVSRLQPWANTW